MTATIQSKPGVSPLSLAHEKIVAAVKVAAEITPLPVLVINSLNDSTHRVGSFHYKNKAVDLQTKLMAPGAEVAFAKELAERLGCTEVRAPGRDWQEPGGLGYRVLLESLNVTGKEHVHLEWRQA